MTDLQDIIARLEAATGPDRELDRDICLLVGPYRSDLWEKHPDHSNLLRTKDATANDWVVAWNYTGSLDAALTLVPENHRWTISSEEFDGGGDPILPSAFVGLFGADYSPDQFNVAKTPAIALCIAIMKARSRTDAKGEK